jgi:hypothetical protein
LFARSLLRKRGAGSKASGVVRPVPKARAQEHERVTQGERCKKACTFSLRRQKKAKKKQERDSFIFVVICTITASMGGDEEVAGAGGVSPARRTALFTLASLHVILCSGTAYGWTAIRPVLKNAGVFRASTALEQDRKVREKTFHSADELSRSLPLSPPSRDRDRASERDRTSRGKGIGSPRAGRASISRHTHTQYRAHCQKSVGAVSSFQKRQGTLPHSSFPPSDRPPRSLAYPCLPRLLLSLLLLTLDPPLHPPSHFSLPPFKPIHTCIHTTLVFFVFRS